jgi:hypothetical protein
MPRFSARLTAARAALLLVVPALAHAQGDTTSIACAGEIVSRVDIQPSPPPFSGAAKKWRAVAHAIGLHHATTNDGVISAFLSLTPGRPCTEFRRAESERVLRAQPFLSDASVRVRRDSAGYVTVLVETTDEIPVLVNGRFRGLVPEAFSLGNENVGGAALRLEARIERGRAYRTSYGARIEQNAFFGRPYRLNVLADQYQIGHRLSGEVEHPFFTDLQRISWHAGISARNDYFRFERPARDPLGLGVNDRAWDVSSLLRIFGTSTVGLLGGAITGRTFEPAAAGIVIDDTGLRADTGVTLRQRYAMFRATRVGVTGGIRRVKFRTMTGFDALVGAQDVPYGGMLAVFAGKSIPRNGSDDMLFSGAGYVGATSGNVWIGTLAQAEVRHDLMLGQWNSAIGSARSALYWGKAPGAVMVLEHELSVGWKSVLPMQLNFRDREGGLIGYRNSGLAGAERSVSRAEVRWSAASLVRRADLGIAGFTEVGRLWKGDVPYGITATRASAGISLLGAYPTRSKRMYRVDLAVPFTRGGYGGGGVEVRFTSADRTQRFWTEPNDVARARTGTEPARLFAWPNR